MANKTPTKIDFAELYQRLQGQPEYEPGLVLPSDRVLSHGSGHYHQSKKMGLA